MHLSRIAFSANDLRGWTGRRRLIALRGLKEAKGVDRVERIELRQLLERLERLNG